MFITIEKRSVKITEFSPYTLQLAHCNGFSSPNLEPFKVGLILSTDIEINVRSNRHYNSYKTSIHKKDRVLISIRKCHYPQKVSETLERSKKKLLSPLLEEQTLRSVDLNKCQHPGHFLRLVMNGIGWLCFSKNILLMV